MQVTAGNRRACTVRGERSGLLASFPLRCQNAEPTLRGQLELTAVGQFSDGEILVSAKG